MVTLPLGAALEAIARLQLGEAIDQRDIEPRLAALRAADAPTHLAFAFALQALADHELGRGDLAIARRYAHEAVVAATRSQRDTAIVLAHDVAARVALAEGRKTAIHAEAVAAIDVSSLSVRAKLAHAELVRATLPV